jgi:mRNA-degrading endonuclease YafQ of YafQ-DinJ toxin-antitoxin module
LSWPLSTTAFHDRRARKFLATRPDLRPRFTETLAQLATDPFDPSLRLHALSGKLQGLQAVSLTYRLRMPLTLQVTERDIRFIDIGSHDEVYG